MEYLRVRNWRKFQHYKKRNPPWIRVYRDILHDPNYLDLPESTRSHLLGLWLLAARGENKICSDQRWLRRELRSNSTVDIDLLKLKGWLEDWTKSDSGVLAPSQQDATPETETETETERTETEPAPLLANSQTKSVFPERDPNREYRVVLKLPTCCTENGRPLQFDIDEYDVEEWKHAMPGLNVLAHLRRAKQYLESHPEKLQMFDNDWDSYWFCDRWLKREHADQGKSASVR